MQGEYIAPEKIEGVYQKHELIAQAFVYGDSLQPSVVGIIVPDKEALLRWASDKDMSPEQLCASEGVKKEILGLLTTYGKQNDLKSFEQIKALYLTMDEFTVDNDLLTPTFKLKREVAKNVYAEQIKDMYATLSNGRSFN